MEKKEEFDIDEPIIIKVLDSESNSNDLISSSVSKKDDNKRKKILRENIIMLVKKSGIMIIMFYILFFQVFGFTRIKDKSMSPNIAAGDLLFFYRLDKNYLIGDVVTFKLKDKRYNLRVIAVGGQTVSLGKDGSFLVDGSSEIHPTYFKTFVPITKGVTYPYKVPKNKVFLVGDYRVEADDSRMFGAVDISKIEGKVISLVQTKDI